MDNIRSECINKLWRGKDPFVGFPRNVYEKDTQGWGSAHPYLVESMPSLQPRIIVEIGVWKGGSTIAMAKRLKELDLDSVIISVDTWLGAWDHWIAPDWFEHLGWDHGYPALQRKFMCNVLEAGVENFVVPMPLDSVNASYVLKHYNFQVDMLHIDGAHDFDAATLDLRMWWPLLRPGGLLIGDDYYPDKHWPGVKRAFDEFLSTVAASPMEQTAGKCRVYKKNE